MAGGWYDQHPEFVRQLGIITAIKAEFDAKKDPKNKNKGPAKGRTKVPLS